MMKHYKIFANIQGSAGDWFYVDAPDETSAVDLVEKIVRNGGADIVYTPYDVACDRIIASDYTEAELAKIENDRLRQAGQLELFAVAAPRDEATP